MHKNMLALGSFIIFGLQWTSAKSAPLRLKGSQTKTTQRAVKEKVPKGASGVPSTMPSIAPSGAPVSKDPSHAPTVAPTTAVPTAATGVPILSPQPTVVQQTDAPVEEELLFYSIDLIPFFVTFEGDLTGDEDFGLELFLFQQMGETFDDIVDVELDQQIVLSDQNSRRLEGSTLEFTGFATFEGNSIHSDALVQDAQRRALVDVDMLQDFWKEKFPQQSAESSFDSLKIDTIPETESDEVWYIEHMFWMVTGLVGFLTLVLIFLLMRSCCSRESHRDVDPTLWSSEVHKGRGLGGLPPEIDSDENQEDYENSLMATPAILKTFEESLASESPKSGTTTEKDPIQNVDNKEKKVDVGDTQQGEKGSTLKIVDPSESLVAGCSSFNEVIEDTWVHFTGSLMTSAVAALSDTAKDEVRPTPKASKEPSSPAIYTPSLLDKDEASTAYTPTVQTFQNSAVSSTQTSVAPSEDRTSAFANSMGTRDRSHPSFTPQSVQATKEMSTVRETEDYYEDESQFSYGGVATQSTFGSIGTKSFDNATSVGSLNMSRFSMGQNTQSSEGAVVYDSNSAVPGTEELLKGSPFVRVESDISVPFDENPKSVASDEMAKELAARELSELSAVVKSARSKIQNQRAMLHDTNGVPVTAGSPQKKSNFEGGREVLQDLQEFSELIEQRRRRNGA